MINYKFPEVYKTLPEKVKDRIYHDYRYIHKCMAVNNDAYNKCMEKKVNALSEYLKALVDVEMISNNDFKEFYDGIFEGR